VKIAASFGSDRKKTGHFASRLARPASPVAMFHAGARASVGARLSGLPATRVDCPGRATRRAPPPRASAPTTGKHRRKRAPRAVVLRRGHFKRLDEVERPPWSLRVDADVHEMGMQEHDALNPEPGRRRNASGSAKLDNDATTVSTGASPDDARGADGHSHRGAEKRTADEDEDEKNRKTGVVFDASVRPVGAAGFFVEGSVKASIVVECDRCGCACVRVTKTKVNAWLDENAIEEDASGDWDVVPFPKTAEECDLTSVVRDAIRLDAPYETFCEACLEASAGGGDADKRFLFALEPEDG
jgi:uncharacterized metal-binding protein YceD (DUF177 family)